MDKQFLERLLATFKLEADEHIANISNGLIKYEQCREDEERAALLEIIFREAHSLKGAARAVSLWDIEGICQKIENVFAGLKKRELSPGKQIFDKLHDGVAAIELYLDAPEAAKHALAENLERIANELSELSTIHFINPAKEARANIQADAAEKPYRAVSEPAKESNDAPQPALPPVTGAKEKNPVPKLSISDSVRISSGKIDRVFLLAEEILSTKINYSHLEDDFAALLEFISDWKREWRKASSRMNLARKHAEKQLQPQNGNLSGDLLSVLDFLDWNQDYVQKLEKRIVQMERFTFQNTKQFGSLLNVMTDDLKEIMMLPFSHLLDIVPKMARELARDLGKEIEINISGAELEVDKRILETLKDPIIHLVRNAIDHGIESPAVRTEKGKPARGAIFISVFAAENNRVELVLKDDGRGVDAEEILRSAIRHNLIGSDEAASLSEQEILQLIFRSGVSTSQVITDISGRGLGMAIVKEHIERLNGYISIASAHGSGTAITVSVPAAIAAMRGLMVLCADRQFILPTSRVDRALRVRKDDIKTVENRNTILIDDIPTSLVPLSAPLGLPAIENPNEKYVTAVAIAGVDARIAFVVDAILEESEILIKPFNKQIEKIRNVAGVTILGNGKVVPILDTADLLRNARIAGTPPAVTDSLRHEEKKSILVVDDSITSRMLVRDILENAGFSVKTAIDGTDALALLRTFSFHLVVTDVEMPRMNGFELTKFIRADSVLSDLPVVLVTGLAKREDREQGIEAGANAYILKSSFDQSILIDTIQRLVV